MEQVSALEDQAQGSCREERHSSATLNEVECGCRPAGLRQR
jgi:hypothetical protein